MNIYLTIFIGGGLGSLSRFAVSKVVTGNFENINPTATLIANLLATIILGIFAYFVHTKYALPTYWKTLLVTGFCGGFSTFSTFSFETFELLRMGNYSWALLNIFISSLLAIAALLLLSKLAS